MSLWEYTETELWRHGAEGISLYHVFGLVAAGRTVLAFSEARAGSGGDADCTHDICIRRSSDGGLHFEPSVRLLSGDRGECWTNPVPVYDDQTGRLFLFVSDNRGNCRTGNYLMHSEDLGITWSEPRQINAALEACDDPLPFHLAGPGHGLRLKNGAHKGRLIVPFWHRRHGVEKSPTSAVIASPCFTATVTVQPSSTPRPSAANISPMNPASSKRRTAFCGSSVPAATIPAASKAAARMAAIHGANPARWPAVPPTTVMRAHVPSPAGRAGRTSSSSPAFRQWSADGTWKSSSAPTAAQPFPHASPRLAATPCPVTAICV